MRDLEFKAWHIEGKYWINSADWPFITLRGEIGRIEKMAHNGKSIVGYLMDELDWEIVQYTGIKDKYNHKIYEKDIVEISIKKPYTNEIINWEENGFWFKDSNGMMNLPLQKYLKKVGSSLEYPELVKV